MARVRGAIPEVNGHDVDELEDHLRQQIADLNAAGLADDEAFLIGIKRMGDVDELSREFAREHTVGFGNSSCAASDDADARIERRLRGTRLRRRSSRGDSDRAARAGFPDDEPAWFARNVSLFVLPFLAAYFAYRRQLDPRGGRSRQRRSSSRRS